MSPDRYLRGRQVILASNRGPLSYSLDKDGVLQQKRGGGGLITAVDALLAAADGSVWINAASNDAERLLAQADQPVSSPDKSYKVIFADVPEGSYADYYDAVSNRILWFLHHYLFSPAYEPVYDGGFSKAWAAYKNANDTIAGEIIRALPDGRNSVVMVQDYHLYLVAERICQERPEALISFFHHIPWCCADYFRLLPAVYRNAILKSLLSCDVVGFHTWRYVDNFLDCCAQFLNADVDKQTHTVHLGGRTVLARAYPISIDPGSLIEQARSPEVAVKAEKLIKDMAGRKLLIRVDRAELSKNLLRGFQAYELFLERHPDWLGKVTFLALAYPTRENIPAYKQYMQAVKRKVDDVNSRFSTHDWRPIEFDIQDDYSRSLAAMSVCDCLLTNPIFDGMNLVAKEAAVVNSRDGVLILSETAGASEELRDAALLVSPFDIEAMAEKIEQALTMPEKEKKARSQRLRHIVMANDSTKWLAHQLDDLFSSHANQSANSRTDAAQ